MANRPLKPCCAPGCSKLVRGQRFCEAHKDRIEKRKAAMPRQSSTQRGYGYRWQQARRTFLSANPLCVKCCAQGKVVEATEVDHIESHRGDQTLFWDRNNWQALCKSCHSKKTATEDGGFGNDRGV